MAIGFKLLEHRYRRLLIVALSVCCLYLLIPYPTSSWRVQHPIWENLEITGRHPLEVLVENGRKRFQEVVSRQSKTLKQAQKEYKRRYRKKPPKGFSEWYHWAEENNITRIDEYDDLDRWIAPYRKVEPQRLRDLLESAFYGAGGLTRLLIRDHKLTGLDHDRIPVLQELQNQIDEAVSKGGSSFEAPEESETYWHERELRLLLDPILHLLPDLEIIFNAWDEPRRLMGGTNEDLGTAEFITNSYHDSREQLVDKPCRQFEGKPIEEPYKPYILNLPMSKEICLHQDVGGYYGMIRHPYTMSGTEAPVPILSQSRISTTADLTYPSVLYFEALFDERYQDDQDSEWNRKNNDLYWTGRPSGGLNGDDDDWKVYQRQRFVATVNGLVNTTLSQEFTQDVDLYKIRFPAVNQCNSECSTMTEYFNVDNKPDLFDEIYKHKFLFDMDGNVFSLRFYSLMFSRSTVLKQTIQQEYFDEWLFPYVHYIPVSMGFEELPDMMRFLAKTQRGQDIAEQIAQDGRNWALKTFRPIEGTSYLYRLFMEYAELFE